MSDRIEVSNYGEMLAIVQDLEPVFYAEAGSYQGDYIAVNADERRFFIFSDYYGSCSGCDWLAAERDWDDETVSYKAANEFCGQSKPKLILPKDAYSRNHLRAVLNGVLSDGYTKLSEDDIDNAMLAIAKHLDRATDGASS